MPVYKNIEDAPSDLQRLLLLAVPENELGHKSITHLADILSLNRWSVNKWIINGRISPARAMQVVNISEGRVSLADFSRFIFAA
jgi:hypothetical protein